MTTTRETSTPAFLAGDEYSIPTYRVLSQDGRLIEGAEAPQLERAKRAVSTRQCSPPA